MKSIINNSNLKLFERICLAPKHKSVFICRRIPAGLLNDGGESAISRIWDSTYGAATCS